MAMDCQELSAADGLFTTSLWLCCRYASC